MKKQLLSIFAATTVTISVFAQTPSSSWTITQHAAFPTATLGIKFMDAVDQNIVWVASGDFGAQGVQTIPTKYYSRTIDGGNTFTSGIIPNVGIGNTYEIGNLIGIDANTAWIACYNQITSGNGALFKTSNGGSTWVNMTGAGMYTNTAQSFLNSVAFLTPSVGLALGDPVNMGGQDEFEIWRTVDGGLSWTQVPGVNIPNPSQNGEFGIVDLYTTQGNSNIWFGTNDGRIFRSTNAGLTWASSVVSAPGSTLTEIAFTSPLDGLVYVDNSGNFEMYSTSDGGVTWSLITTPSNVGEFDLVAIPGTSYYASVGVEPTTGNNVISYSNNNGASWIDWGSVGIDYWTLDFVNISTGWAGTIGDLTTVGGYTNVYKFNGNLAQGVVPQSSSFYLPPILCLTTSTALAVNTSTGTAPLSYTWSAAPAGAVFSSNTASAPVVTFNASGTYTISLEVAGNVGNNNISSQVVQVLNCSVPSPNFGIAATGCNSVDIVTTNNSTGMPAPSYSWIVVPNNGVTIAPSLIAATPSINFTVPGDYSVTLISTNTSSSVASTNVVHIDDCRPTPSFSLHLGSSTTYSFDGLHICRKTASKTDTLYTDNTTLGSGITYSWTIATSATLNTGVTAINNGSANKRFIFLAPTNTTPTAPTQTNYTITLKATNASGSNTVSQIVTAVDCNRDALGISENTLSENMAVYPNPAHEQLTLSLPNANQTYNVKMVNILGSIVYETVVKNTTELNISVANKTQGIYFLTVESNGEKATKKIIVE